MLAPEISFGGNFAYDRNGHFYHTTTVYGYVKKGDIGVSYETLMAILNSQICWWYVSHTGTILSNGYFRYKPTYIKDFPIPDVPPNIDSYIQRILKNGGQESTELTGVICSLYNLSKEEILDIYNN